MHENRTQYPTKKTQLYQQLQELPKKYNVLALVRMEKVRSSQLLPLRKKLQGEVEIISVKDKIAKIALEKTGIKGIEKLIDKLAGQCLFMFTNMSPFKLNVLLGKNKVMLGARGGDLASMDVVIPPKNTGIAPGPMLTDFKENKIPNGIRINRYGYDILIRMLNKFASPLDNLSINPRIPCFSTNSVIPTFSGLVNNSA